MLTSIARCGLATLLFGISACHDQGLLQIDFVATPAAPNAGQASLTLDQHGQPLLSWLELNEGEAIFQFSRWQKDRWSAPRTIAEGSDWFVNWADFPAVSATTDGRMLAHYLRKSASRTYAYDVLTQVSHDQGLTWQSSSSPHRDGTPTEHGFVSYFDTSEGPGIVWLDGRNTAANGNGDHSNGHDSHGTTAMILRATTLDSTGQWRTSQQLDGRVCDCCQTAAANTALGPIVVYRDRSEQEIRDIAIVRRLDGQWTEPALVHADNWQIEACPVNGPAIAAMDKQVAVAWFTMATGEAAVKLALSADAGASFATPIQLDQGLALGRVDVGLLSDGRAVVAWLETNAFDETRVQLAVVRDGQIVNRTAVGQTSPARGSGFPRLVVAADDVFLVWREVADPMVGGREVPNQEEMPKQKLANVGRLKTARLRLGELRE